MIATRRLYCQQLAGTRFAQPGELVRWIGAIQAQDYAGAKWAVGRRTPGCTDRAVEQALIDRSILRTWVFRGTLHFVPAEDIHWMVDLVASRLVAGLANRYRSLELDERTLARSSALLAEAVEGTPPPKRSELLALLEDNGISTHGLRGAFILQRASLEGLICQGEMVRNNPTYLHLPEGRKLGREEALAELARRYFFSHGPATLQDFTYWTGLLTAEARAGLGAIQSQLVSETIEGETYWASPSMQTGLSISPTVYLSPGYDEYLLGYRDRSAVLDPQEEKFIFRGNGFSPMLIVDGRVVGVWQRALTKGTMSITVKPFYPLSADENQALISEVNDYGAFLGLPVNLMDLPGFS